MGARDPADVLTEALDVGVQALLDRLSQAPTLFFRGFLGPEVEAEGGYRPD